MLSRCNFHKHAADGTLKERKYSRSRVDRSVDCSYVGYHVRWDRIWGGVGSDVEQMEVGKMRLLGVYPSSFGLQHVYSARNLQPVVA